MHGKRRALEPSLTLVLIVAGAVPAAGQPGAGDFVFDLGEIVVVGRRPDGLSSVGGSLVTREQSWTFQKTTLAQALELAPGVSTTMRGRRNESDVFVRGFGRWQVPLSIDGVRVYLPADNRIDFGRFLTADIEAVQIQKGYASVLDGPGAMGGAINLVTRKPAEPFEAEGGAALGASGVDGWSGHVIAGARRDGFYVQGSAAYAARDAWELAEDYVPVPGSLEDGGERLGSNSRDWHVNLKLGFTPNDTDEYTVSYSSQEGEKGAPLNVYNNPPVPPASFWRWPYWNLQNVAFLTATQIGSDAYVKTRTYYSAFENGLDSYDDLSYSTQSSPRASFSASDDHAYGASIELGTTQFASSTPKVAFHYRRDFHAEQQTRRPTHGQLSFTEPEQRQAQATWSVAVENTFHVHSDVDIVLGASYDDYEVKRAEEFDSAIAPNVFEHPLGGSDAFNWQSAIIWRYRDGAQIHASLSDRGRFPTFFELYSTRFGTATPNPDLGPERATNFELGWEATTVGGTRLAGAVFYNDIEDLIQTAVLPDATTQPQNVGNGRFYGVEVSFETRLGTAVSVGGNYTHIDQKVEDALQPDLEVDGMPDNKVRLYASWHAAEQLVVTPSIEAADERVSPVNPPTPNAYVRTGAYTLVNVDASFTFQSGLELALGAKNLLDESYELAWGFPEPGRSVYVKARFTF